MKQTEYPHIYLDPKGQAQLGNSRMKVAHLATGHVHHGWSAQELFWQYPNLSLAEIHSALAYYYDHKDSVDLELQKAEVELEKLGSNTDRFKRRELLERVAGITGSEQQASTG